MRFTREPNDCTEIAVAIAAIFTSGPSCSHELTDSCLGTYMTYIGSIVPMMYSVTVQGSTFHVKHVISLENWVYPPLPGHIAGCTCHVVGPALHCQDIDHILSGY